ncbi:MAG: hypothetical protein KDB80_01430 [Planctomycetes bacterium]|nr:hypothetical protein [Planctomycetota bacterium]
MTDLSRASSFARAVTTAVGALATIVLSGCSGGGSADSPPGTSGDFLVLRTEPANNGQLFLNESISIDFSNPVALDSADLNTVNFQVFDLNDNPLTEQPAGTFEVGTSPGDSNPGRRLVFAPRFPTNDTFDNGGFRPGRKYIVSLPAGQNVTTLNDASTGRKLERPASFIFSTADGTTPFELFRDTKPGGPRRAGFSVSGVSGGFAPLGLLGNAPVEIRLDFDQPLNPSTFNVPTNLDPDPSQRVGLDRGRMYLEYDNGATTGIWIPATVEIERNSLTGATVVMRPIGVMPNNATIRVIVQRTVEDMAGESNISDTAYNSTFATFRTQPAFEPQYDALVEQFVAGANTVDLDAPVLEPLAEVKSGRLRSTFAFDGQASTLDYEPSARETVLDTNFTQVAPVGSEPINVAGGVFRFRNVSIPAGKTVRGVGPNPMVWLVTGDFEVAGTLQVDGGDGARVDTLNSANFPSAGGVGVCGGGNGGKGSPFTARRSGRGEAGFGPGQRPGIGGRGGRYHCTGGGETGGGGGGGSFATEGDPEFNDGNNNYVQWRGTGGRSSNAGGAGGNPGDLAFTDSRDDNDFWGSGVNIHRGIRIQGELLAPQGGSGGGGGGDRSTSCAISGSFIGDEKGGGGGAGGGVLIIQALGKVIVRGTGTISANGGNGGGGEQAGSNNAGGGGGGGSGGMVVIMAAGGVEIVQHGGSYANDNNNFAISADGGIGLQGDFIGNQIDDKYAGYSPNNQIRASGGFGGMGIVQILVPPGEDDDGTGSFVDDNITFTNNGSPVGTNTKIELIAWRGWPDEEGVRRDDIGRSIATDLGIDDDGDIRPAPILLPLPFGPTSRAQSRWIDLGAVAREPGNSGPNVVNVAPPPQPDFEFDGLLTSGDDAGYVEWSGGVQSVPEVLAPVAFSDLRTDQVAAGQSAYRVRVTSGALGVQPNNRYAHYRAEFVDDNGNRLTDLRILAHERIAGGSDSYVYFEPTAVFPAAATRLRILAKFFALETDGQQGLGPLDAGRPRSNVRIGFAFHADPNASDPSERFPVTGFSANVNGPGGLLEQMSAVGKRAVLVKWDILFDQRFGQPSAPLVPSMPSQTLDYLVLPFRF